MKIYSFIKKLRSKLLVYLTHQMALPILQLVRKPLVFPYSAGELKEFPAGSMGNDLVKFLETKNLQLLPHYAKHDMKHILLEYDTTDEGEACLQCFMLGNRHISFPVLATVMYGVFTMPEYWGSFRRAYLRGRKCISIDPWKWFELLTVPTKELQNKINQIK